jgi:hypothetical protein
MTFDLRAAARAHCPEALRVIAAAMRSEDEEVRALASQAMRKFLRDLRPEEPADKPN